MTYAIKHLFHINTSREKVFEAISTIKGLSNWWTTETIGEASLKGIIQFRFANAGGPDMQVVVVESNSKLVWECVESNHGWKGHVFTFLLDENEGKTRVRFSHEGWKEQDDFYAICCFTWGRYM